MGESTNISWTDHTWSPWWGCFKISPGCDRCYAAALDKRIGGENWSRKGPRRFFSEAHWRKPLKWNEAAKRDGVRRRVFPSMCDPFEDRPDLDRVRNELWDLIEQCDWLDWLLLTKRPENLDNRLPWWGAHHSTDPYPNVWLGVTAEDQEHYDERWPILRETPAAVRFISYEPALGPLRLSYPNVRPLPDWLIAGDESGGRRRSAQPDWIRAIRDDCGLYGVAFHFKQWCGESDGSIAGERVAGKIHLPILDGQQWAAFPTQH